MIDKGRFTSGPCFRFKSLGKMQIDTVRQPSC